MIKYFALNDKHAHISYFCGRKILRDFLDCVTEIWQVGGLASTANFEFKQNSAENIELKLAAVFSTQHPTPILSIWSLIRVFL